MLITRTSAFSGVTRTLDLLGQGVQIKIIITKRAVYILTANGRIIEIA